MATFKEYVLMDLDAFINIDEMAESHTINGTAYDIIFDSSTGIEAGSDSIGIYQGNTTIYVMSADLGERPKPGQILELDNVPYTVVNSAEESGMYKIILESGEG